MRKVILLVLILIFLFCPNVLSRSLLDPSNPPIITVTNPNGETLKQGDTIDINWAYKGKFPWKEAEIYLIQGNEIIATITDKAGPTYKRNSEEDGTYQWKIPINKPKFAGDNFQIQVKIIAFNDPVISGTSRPFSIIADQATVRIIAPNGDRWRGGQTNTIKWEYTGNPGELIIQLVDTTPHHHPNSLMPPIPVTTIAVVPCGSNGQGSYEWNTPNGLQDHPYQIKIKSYTYPSVFALSEIFWVDQ